MHCTLTQNYRIPPDIVFVSMFLCLVIISQQSITNILGVRVALGIDKYIGLPSMTWRSKKATFSFIKDKVW